MNGQKRASGCFFAALIVLGLIVFLMFGIGSCSHSSSSHRSSYTTARFRTTYKYIPTTTTTAAARSTTSSARPYTYTYRSTTKASSDDPYDAKDYVDAEDFYDDHYDDFFDFEDAEDYWYENS